MVTSCTDRHTQHPPPSGPARPIREDLPLTRRELEILQLVASGSTNAAIAQRLWVTEQTVKFHLRNIYRKLNVANRTQASHFAHARGLVDFATTPEPVLSIAAA